MFTGLITDVGVVLSIRAKPAWRVCIGTHYPALDLYQGASIACDGVCLTLTDCGTLDTPTPHNHQTWFTADVSFETLDKTTLATWQADLHINLERALKVGDELGGHIVSGHIDGTAYVRKCYADGENTRLTLSTDPILNQFIAPKGSVALNGTSLTVNDAGHDWFTVNLIAYTKAATTWNTIATGARVNVEVDMLARYIARYRTASAALNA